MKHNWCVEIHQQQTTANHQTASELLVATGKLTANQIQHCFENGAVWLQANHKPRRLYEANTIVTKGQLIHCYCNISTLSECPFKASLVADFDAFSIWNKPSGMLCQGSKWGDHWALYRWIKQNYWPDRQSFITHRIDRFTSGLVIVAHTELINKKFHRLFENRLIKKTYRAIVKGLLPLNQQFTLNTPVQNKKAISEIWVGDLQPATERSLVLIKPHTGRKHQIRIHLADCGHPIVNDRQYGQPPFDGDLQLQASDLQFNNPLDDQSVKVSLPSDKLLKF